MACIYARPVERATVCRAAKTLCYKSFSFKKFIFQQYCMLRAAPPARHAFFVKVRRAALESHHA